MYKFFNDLSTLGDFDVLFDELDLDYQPIANLETQPIFFQSNNVVAEGNASPGIGDVTSVNQGTVWWETPAPDPETLIGSDGYAIPSFITAAPGSNLSFTVTDVGGVGAGSNAESGFLAAAALWMSFLADDVNIRLDAGFSSLNPGVLAQAGSATSVVSYAAFRTALIADGSSPDDATAIANLQAGPSLLFATNDVNGNLVLDNDTSGTQANNNNFLAVNNTTLRALGITLDANGNPVDDGSSDITITFSSDFTWDFDPTDGITAGAIDFVGVAFHEIGHGLGFRSGVDTVDVFSDNGPGATQDLNPFAIFTALDVFRYSDLTNTNNPGALDLGYGGDPFFSIDGGVTNLGFFSSGSFNGDGNQASHWRDGLGLGIMDPTSAPAGQANMITELDLRAFDVIGWDRVGLNGDILLTNGNDSYTGTGDDETIFGLDGNDTIDSGSGDDFIYGDDGADTLTGGAGADSLNGGAGFDSADYRSASTGVRFNVDTGGTVGDANGDTFSGIERYYLSDFADIVTGSDANEFFFGEDGNDQINGGGGIDRIYGGDGDDVQRGQDGNDQLYGSAGNDQLNGGAGFDIANYRDATSAVTLDIASGGTLGDAAGDTYFGLEAIYGSDFNDNITGNSSANELRGFDGDDTLNGGGGNDRLFGGLGADTLNGGTGIDIVNYTLAASTVNVDLSAGGSDGEALGDTYSSIEWVFGSDFGDTITGDTGNNRLEGRGGDDLLGGAGGNDRLLGGDGNDTIFGGDGIDTIFGQNGNDTISGDSGNDFIFGSSGGDAIDGGADFDTVSYLASSSGVIVNLAVGGTGGDADGDTYVNIERVFGTSFDDSISGSDGNDVLLGNGGSDYLIGGQGNDSLIGGAGSDSFGYDTANDGADVISDFFGGETIFILGGNTNFDTFAELQAIASDAGANVIFDFGGGNTLTVVGRNIADLSVGDFDFSGTPPASEPLDNPDAFAADIVDIFDMDALV